MSFWCNKFWHVGTTGRSQQKDMTWVEKGLAAMWELLLIFLKPLAKKVHHVGHWWLMPYNPSYLRSWDQKDHGSRSVWEDSSWDPHLQNNHSNAHVNKWTTITKNNQSKMEGVVPVAEYLLCKHKALNSKCQSHQK
jgi:hypothetical protein